MISVTQNIRNITSHYKDQSHIDLAVRT